MVSTRLPSLKEATIDKTLRALAAGKHVLYAESKRDGAFTRSASIEIVVSLKKQ